MKVQSKLTWWKGIVAAVILVLVLFLLAVTFNLATGLDSGAATDAPRALVTARVAAG